MEFRSQINYELPCVEPARKLAKEALYAYSEGKPQQLGEIMARSLRINMREAASKNQIVHSTTWRTLYLVSKMVETLDKHPDVRDASGLKPGPSVLPIPRSYYFLTNDLRLSVSTG